MSRQALSGAELTPAGTTVLSAAVPLSRLIELENAGFDAAATDTRSSLRSEEHAQPVQPAQTARTPFCPLSPFCPLCSARAACADPFLSAQPAEPAVDALLVS